VHTDFDGLTLHLLALQCRVRSDLGISHVVSCGHTMSADLIWAAEVVSSGAGRYTQHKHRELTFLLVRVRLFAGHGVVLNCLERQMRWKEKTAVLVPVRRCRG
jgi:hypothetical protein